MRLSHSSSEPSVFPQVRDVEQEVLLLWGRDDEILDVKYAEEFQRDLRRVTTHVIDACGHVAHLERPDVAADAILGFADRPSSSGSDGALSERGAGTPAASAAA